MKERPILFSGPMVRAILAGQKTQTRRLVTVPGQGRKRRLPGGDEFEEQDGRLLFRDHDEEWHDFEAAWDCPYAEVGDKLWVREAFAVGTILPIRYLYGPLRDLEFRKHGGGAPTGPIDLRVGHTDGNVYYREHPTSPAELAASPGFTSYRSTSPESWRPSIFMPRWASRILLEVVAVRVERLQDISEADILAEGVTVDAVAKWTNTPWSDMPTLHHAMRVLWDSINGARAGADWASNPWVWTLTFRRLEAP